MNKTTIQSIQVLRGLAALLVVLHHITGNIEKTYNLACIHEPFKIGFAGVDLFFVISGFIIFHTSEGYLFQPVFLVAYLKKRILRIFPIYWLFTIPLLGIAFLLKNKMAFSYNFLAINIIETLSLAPQHPTINPVTWTLSYELFFYSLFACLILSRYALILPLLVLLLSAINVATGMFGTGLLNASGLYFYFSPFNFEFLLGGLVFWLYKSPAISVNSCIVLLVLALLIIASQGLSMLDDITNSRVAVFGLASFLITLAAVRYEYIRKPKMPAYLLLLGDASYSIYLIHFPLIIVANKLLATFSIHTTTALAANGLLLVGLIVFGNFVHKKIEKPLVSYLSKL